MSECQTIVEQIKEINPLIGADRLELATCRGWQCVVSKGVYKTNDLCVYIPIDSVLPEALESLLFSGTKISLTKGRVKTIKLRGAISQGLIANIVTIENYLGKKLNVGDDVTELLGIVKYEPPAPKFQSNSGKQCKGKENTHLSKYTSLENINNYSDIFKPNDIVVCTEKVHGTNFRAGWVPYVNDTLFKKVKNFFGLSPKWEFVYGSHNVQLQNVGKNDNKFHETNIYYKTVQQYNLKERIPKGVVVYGEIYGDGIQKNYNYGLKNETRLIIFDVQTIELDGKKEYENIIEGLQYAEQMGLETVPILYTGYYRDLVPDELFKGNSIVSDSQKIKEGFVIDSIDEKNCIMGRKKLKVINPEYLLQKNNTDYH